MVLTVEDIREEGLPDWMQVKTFECLQVHGVCCADEVSRVAGLKTRKMCGDVSWLVCCWKV